MKVDNLTRIEKYKVEELLAEDIFQNIHRKDLDDYTTPFLTSFISKLLKKEMFR